MKLQGLELEIEGSREDIPSIAQNLGNQIAGVLQPTAAIANGTALPAQRIPVTIDHAEADGQNGRKQPRRRRRSNGESAASKNATTIEWKHDPAKYGNPRQEWGAGTKALWTLYVVEQELGLTQLSASQLTETFNRKFKHSGQVRGTNVSRDLGNMKGKVPAMVGDDTTKSPIEWFLVEAGSKR